MYIFIYVNLYIYLSIHRISKLYVRAKVHDCVRAARPTWSFGQYLCLTYAHAQI